MITQPKYLINKFAEIFCQCYQRLVDKKKTPSIKLKKRLDLLNHKMVSLSQQEEIKLSTPALEETEGNIVQLFQQKPNYLLTDQVMGDVKTFIRLLLKVTKSFYAPVIRPAEMEDMKEDFVEAITTLVLTKEVYKIVFSFFRLENTDIEKNLRDRFKEFKKITPGECRVNEYFRCDATSPILKLHKDIINHNEILTKSELMSINFDIQMRNSQTNKKLFERHKSFVNENGAGLEKILEVEEDKIANS